MFHSKTMQVDPLPANLVSIAWLLVLGAMRLCWIQRW